MRILIGQLMFPILHPRIFFYNKIAPRLQHLKNSNYDVTAIIYNPLVFCAKNIAIGKNVYIGNLSRIQCIDEYFGAKYQPELSIGEGTSIQQNLHLTCAKKISIGKDCSFTHNITITDIDHSFEYTPTNTPPRCNKLITNDVVIGNYCMVFPNTVILGGTSIGNNCVIGANSVVRGKFPDNCLIAGIPAKIIKIYNPNNDKWERVNTTK